MCRFIPTLVVTLWCAAIAIPTSATGPARLLQDINPTPSGNRSSYSDHFHRLGNVALFHAYTRATGSELWRTDGTEAGTTLVKDIRPGREWGFENGFGVPESALDFTALGDKLIFLANDGAHGVEIWRTDGTTAGTAMVKDLRPGSQSPFDAEVDRTPGVLWEHVEVGGTMYFVADEGVHGFELWKTDGTEAGTQLVSDIVPGSAGTFGNYFYTRPLSGVGVDGSLFFSVDDGIHGQELFTTDGTATGTRLVKDINPGPSGSSPVRFLPYNGTVLFLAYEPEHGTELWTTDGTESGTTLVKDLDGTYRGSYPDELTEANGAVFFVGPHGLWKTDGTSEGTVPLKQPLSSVSWLRAWNQSLLFLADDGVHGAELWTSDGTEAGTILVKDVKPGSAGSGPYPIDVGAGTRFYFRADDGAHGVELWASDGSEAGTVLVKDIVPGAVGPRFGRTVAAGGALYIVIEDPDTYVDSLWKSDGTEAGTRIVQTPPVSLPMLALNGRLLFVADDGVHGFEPWWTDGSAAGTRLVRDVNPSVETDSSGTRFLGTLSLPGGGERLFFSADDGVHGTELWVTDGTRHGTRMLKDIVPGPYGSWPSLGIAHDGAFLFGDYDDAHGPGLWRTDGTEAGTIWIAAVAPRDDGAYAELDGEVYFVGDDGLNGRALWKSDGTPAGTVQVADVDMTYAFASSNPPVTIGNTIFFGTSDSTHGFELWKTDGTAAGTVLVKDIAPGVGSSGARSFAALDGKLFFSATDSIHGQEPWLSDGTEAGTVLLKDIYPGSHSSRSRVIPSRVFGGALYFSAVDGVHGEDLWRTDGTELGTVLFKDLYPGSGVPSFGGASIDGLTLFDGALFFTSGPTSTYTGLWRSDGTEAGTTAVKSGLGFYELHGLNGGLLLSGMDADHGDEPWRSDGTEGGTAIAQDVVPGVDGSYPHEFTTLGDRVVFLVFDEASGEEPWSAHTSLLLHRPALAVRDLEDELSSLQLPTGIKAGLKAKLESAYRALASGRDVAAILALEDFVKHADVLTPGKIPEESAADLVEFAEDIVTLLQSSGGIQP